jgi:predicted amidohydrolase
MTDTPSGLPTSLRVSLLQLGVPEGESASERLSRVATMVEQEAPDADLVVLPELWMTGYFAFERYADESVTLDDGAIRRMQDIARDHRTHLVAGTFVERGPQGLTNCAVLIDPTGDIVLTYRKMHLFGHGSDESQILVPGRTADVADTAIGTVAMSTCYDLRFPELFRVFAARGAELIIVPAAWPMARVEHWRLFLQARAVENLAFVIGCNGAGVQSGVELGGSSMVIGPWGETIAEAGAAPEIVRTRIDLSSVGRLRADFPVLADRSIRIDAPDPGRSGG